MESTIFEQAPFQVVSDPAQLKAFTDPLRNRIIHILSDHEATNQQVSTLVGEDQAKVLYHIRFLLKVGLVELTRTNIKRGNVEKYYRATARIFSLRISPDDTKSPIGPVFESVVQELFASEGMWPDRMPRWEGRRGRISDARLGEFIKELDALIEEYWGTHQVRDDLEDSASTLMSFFSVLYRFPGVSR